VRWLTPVVPAASEAQIRRNQGSRSVKKKIRDHISTNKAGHGGTCPKSQLCTRCRYEDHSQRLVPGRRMGPYLKNKLK
jgi:hypothetical protein